MSEELRAGAVVLVHQGFELYGSDRTFIESALEIRDHLKPMRMRIILPKPGQLSEKLSGLGFACEFRDIWVARRSNGFWGNLTRLAALPGALIDAYKDGKRSDFIYINTSVVFDYIIISRLFSYKTIIHVHEIPTGIARVVIRFLLSLSGATLIFNSQATARAFGSIAGARRFVVHNGYSLARSAAARSFEGDRRLRLLVLGRLNEWKGQDLAIEALSLLSPEALQLVEIRFVGDAFAAGGAKQELLARTTRLSLDDHVTFSPFVSDPSAHYEWCDVVVVPSKKPEPFGLVAIEAMAFRRAVIAADHGGLKEIVSPGETGLLFEPNSAADLALSIERIVQNPEMVARFGANGYRRYMNHFTIEKMKHEFRSVLDVVRLRK